MKNYFDLNNKVYVITGGAGLLGAKHAEAISEFGGSIALWDIDESRAKVISDKISKKFNNRCIGIKTDITNKDSIDAALELTLKKLNHINGLINNAAKDPKVESKSDVSWSRFENYKQEDWLSDINVGLTGAFLCSQRIGNYLIENDGGVIVNISSDLGIISPDQRIYRIDGIKNKSQPVKPVTYSVIKHGLIGLTKYLATYWADKNIRVNALCPGGIYNKQSDTFVQKLSNLIPMGRMAEMDEYKAAIVFLLSDASSYMTGQNLVIDGGRTIW